VFENRIKRLLAEGKPAWGASPGVASELAAKLTVDTGIDFLWIDTEHGSFDLEAVRMLPVVARMKNCAPMIRVAGLDASLIKRALDFGASTIMVPQVTTAEEAQLAVRYSKYPPEGTRGVSPLWTFLLDVPWQEYLPVANQETCVVVQVESLESVDNVEAIAAVEGVDVVFAGPTDLSASLGYIGQTDHPEVQCILETLPARIASAGKIAGISVGGADAAWRAYQMGYRFIAIGDLLWSGQRGLKADLEKLQGFLANGNGRH
jgi:4-hydroxy-2-oxoheptanedioate aldolase